MIDLKTPLTLKSAFSFPLQSALSKKEVLIGGLVLLIPIVGWLLNMGHRIVMVHKMQRGQQPSPSWNNWGVLLKHGLITWLGMVYYYAPSLLCFFASMRIDQFGLSIVIAVVALGLFILATFAIPGYMSHYCKAFDVTEIFNPFKALRRSFESGKKFLAGLADCHLCAHSFFLGLFIFGIGFLFTSVWFWQVAGYSFACAFTDAFDLQAKE